MVVILVAHNNFKKNKKKIYSYLKKNGFIYDFKNIFKTNKKIITINEKNI